MPTYIVFLCGLLMLLVSVAFSEYSKTGPARIAFVVGVVLVAFSVGAEL